MIAERNIIKITSLIISLLILPSSVLARQFVQSHSTNIQLLWGSGFELGDNSRTTITITHGNQWRYGDTFAFMDITDLGTSYTEVHPRLSLGKISGQSFAFGPVKDILFASTFEFAPGTNRRLFGVGIDWNVPGFEYLKTNVYTRNNPSLEGVTDQLTISWGLPITLGRHKLYFDGFADITGSEGTTVANELVQASALLDIGHYWEQPARLLLGTELNYWNNKFGLAGIDETVFQVQVRYVF